MPEMMPERKAKLEQRAVGAGEDEQRQPDPTPVYAETFPVAPAESDGTLWGIHILKERTGHLLGTFYELTGKPDDQLDEAIDELCLNHNWRRGRSVPGPVAGGGSFSQDAGRGRTPSRASTAAPSTARPRINKASATKQEAAL